MASGGPISVLGETDKLGQLLSFRLATTGRLRLSLGLLFRGLLLLAPHDFYPPKVDACWQAQLELESLVIVLGGLPWPRGRLQLLVCEGANFSAIHAHICQNSWQLGGQLILLDEPLSVIEDFHFHGVLIFLLHLHAIDLQLRLALLLCKQRLLLLNLRLLRPGYIDHRLANYHGLLEGSFLLLLELLLLLLALLLAPLPLLLVFLLEALDYVVFGKFEFGSSCFLPSLTDLVKVIKFVLLCCLAGTRRGNYLQLARAPANTSVLLALFRGNVLLSITIFCLFFVVDGRFLCRNEDLCQVDLIELLHILHVLLVFLGVDQRLVLRLLPLDVLQPLLPLAFKLSQVCWVLIEEHLVD